MKKFVNLFFVLSILILNQCGTEKNSQISESDDITGKWKCIFVGNTVLQLGLSMPINYEFKKNNEFNSLLTVAGERKIFSGTFKIDRTKKPYVINIYRADNREFHGIIKFENDKKFIMILYDKKILPLSDIFGQDDIQIFIRSE